MVEFSKEEEENYKQRLKERAERQAKEAKEAAQEQRAVPDTKAKGAGAFKSRIGQGFAKVLSKTADKAEEYRGKADFVGNQAGRIKKAITPTGKPGKRKAPATMRQYIPKRKKSIARMPVYKPQRAPRTASPDMFDSMLYGGSHGQQSHGNSFDEMINGKKSKHSGRGRDPFKGLI